MNPMLSARLGAHLQALDQQPDHDTVEAAQQKLERRLAATPLKSPRRTWVGWTAAAATACLMLTLVMLPTSHGVAFDAIQKRLSDFTTLTLRIEQQAAGMTMPPITVRLNRAGDARTDFGSASTVIVNAHDRRMLTLLHDSHMAMQMPLPASGKPSEPLDWLKSIRQFQGEAHRLADSRVIDGRPVTGWALDTNGMHIVIWADADALPHAVEISGRGVQMSQRMKVVMDTPLGPRLFSTAVPSGYSLMPADGD